jgi:hypothetical protein
MTQGQKFVIVGAIAGLAWWWYQRSRGLTITGEPINPMLPSSVRLSQQSTVTPNTSTSTWATNVFSAIGSALKTIQASLQSAPGNGPRVASASQTGIAQSDDLTHGLATSPQLIADSPASVVVEPDSSLDESAMFWQWLTPTIAGSYAEQQYEAGGFQVPNMASSNQAGTLRR